MSISTINGVDLERLNATIEAITDDPGLGRFQFRARNHWVDGGHSRTTIQGFYGAGQEDTTRAQAFLVDSDEPTVLLGDRRSEFEPDDIGEIQATLTQVALPLLLVPFQVHSYTTYLIVATK